MKRIVFLVFMVLFGHSSYAQVGIGNTNPNASLDISASDILAPANNDGILIPRMDEFPAINPTAAQDGMMVFITGNGAASRGFYYWDQGTTSWLSLSAGAGTEKLNDLQDARSDVDGTNDGSSLFIGIDSGANDDSSDNQNVGIGYKSLENNTTGDYNTALGFQSLQNNISANYNTAVGKNSLASTTTGAANTALGAEALKDNSTGYYNVALGYEAALSNTSGFQNIAIGMQALRSNTASSFHIAIGRESLYFLNGGSGNLALGYRSLYNTTNASDNVGLGLQALFSNTTGFSNVGLGSNVLYNNTTGSQNVALGRDAGFNYNGSQSVFIGYQAGYNESNGNRLYIENSLANSNNALIYGEFDNNILRTNGELQIGNPSTTGFALPTVDGSANQILATNGNGQLSFVDKSEDIDWYEANTTNQPDAITDNIYTEGNVGIGNSNPTNPLSISGDETTSTLVYLIKNQTTSSVTSYGINIAHTSNTTNSNYGINSTITSTGSGVSYGSYNRMNSTSGATVGFNNRFESGAGATGLFNSFLDGSGSYEGMRNAFSITGRTGETSYGIYNSIIGTGDENIYGAYNNYSGTSGTVFGLKMLAPAVNGVTGNVYGGDVEIYSNGAGDKYGYRTLITSSSGGTPYGVYSSVDNTTTGYAGYFLGRVTVGTLSGNRYILPPSRGTAGQIMQTDGSGNVTWQDNNDVGNFALAKINMSAAQVHPVSAWTKQNFDTVEFDLGSNFDTTTDRFNVTEAGYYRVNASYRSSGNVTTNDLFGISVYVNGSAVKTQIPNHYASGAVFRSVSTLVPLDAGDYVEIYFFANGPLTVTFSPVYTAFEIERIR